ncbi:MAG: hypothetical protein NC434_13940 [Ruminococcus sp.]|nr:hypothetical protein [Ruminococcus sp.]
MENEKRYRREEFQDSDGNAIYFHTDARVVWIPDGDSLWDFIKDDVTDERIAQILMD